MKLVLQRIHFKNCNWIFMIRDVTLGNTSCNLSHNLSRGLHLFHTRNFYWLSNRNIARQFAEGMLHCAMARKCNAALRQSLRKSEPDSTSCNASCNKNVVARLYDYEACYTLHLRLQLVSQQNCETSL